MFTKVLGLLVLFCLFESAIATEPPQPFDCDSILTTQQWDGSMKKVKFHDYDQVLSGYVNGELNKPQSRLALADAQMVENGFQFFHQVYRHKRTFNGFAGPIDYVILERHYVNHAQAQAQTIFVEISIASMVGKAFTPNIFVLTMGAVQPLVVNTATTAQDNSQTPIVDQTPVTPVASPTTSFPPITFDESLKQSHIVDREKLLTDFLTQEFGNSVSELAQSHAQMIQEGLEFATQSIVYTKTDFGFAGPIDHLLFSRTYVNATKNRARMVTAMLFANTVNGSGISTVHIQSVNISIPLLISLSTPEQNAAAPAKVLSETDVLAVVDGIEQSAMVANGRVFSEEYDPNKFNLEQAHADLEAELPNRMFEDDPTEVKVSYQTHSGVTGAVALLDSEVANWLADEYDQMGTQLTDLNKQGLVQAVVYRHKDQQKREDYFEPYYFDIYIQYVVNDQPKGIRLSLHYSLGD